MPAEGTALAIGLHCSHAGDSWRLVADDIWPAVDLRFTVDDGRLHTYAVMLDGRRAIDLSGQPRAITEVVTAAARQSNADPNAWLTLVAHRTHTEAVAAGCRGLTTPPSSPQRHLEAVVGGLRYPALGVAYDAGAMVEPLIPRWARRCVDTATAPDVAQRAFEGKATRAVVRAVGRCISASEGRLPWASLGLAVAGAAVLQPDDITALLDTSEHDETTLFDVDDVGLLRWAARFAGAHHYKRLAADALEHNLVARLLRTWRTVRMVRHQIARPLPVRIEALERAALAVAVVDPRPPEPEATPRPPRPDDGLRPQRWARPRVAPYAPPSEEAAFTYPPDVLAIDATAVGNVTLHLPISGPQLCGWSRLLRNCMDDFVDAVRAGESIIVGVRQRDVLVGALELDRERRLIQFVGARDRRLDDALTTTVVRALRQRGVIRRA